MGKALLSLNCGSSSLKSTLFSYPDLQELASVSASSIGSDSATLKYKSTVNASASASTSGSGSSSGSRSVKGEAHAEIFEDVLSELEHRGTISRKEDVVIVTHRIVHGGTFDKPVTVTKEHQEALQRLEELSAFAPLHNSAAVETVKAVLERLPTAKNLLCFDTLFHHSIPEHIWTYPIAQPEHAPPVPLRRYGFHGLSYQSILTKSAKFLGKPEGETSLIICHLGSGASMCCVKDGKSYDTTMGLTPLEGLPGGTRSGSLDPSLIFHLFPEPESAGKLVETKGMHIGHGELVLNKQSGFQGLCGTSEYGEIASKAEKADGKERLAVKLFENRILNYIGAYLVPLQGAPDAIVFSGGIGEKSASLRASILRQVAWVGVRVDDEANEAAGASEDDAVLISSTKEGSRIKALRVLTDEEGVCAGMARDVFGDKP